MDAIWDEHFVDLVCDPPETFTYGGMIAHVMTLAAQRRGAALQLLHGYGASDAGWGDPIEYDTQERVR